MNTQIPQYEPFTASRLANMNPCADSFAALFDGDGDPFEARTPDELWDEYRTWLDPDNLDIGWLVTRIDLAARYAHLSLPSVSFHTGLDDLCAACDLDRYYIDSHENTDSARLRGNLLNLHDLVINGFADEVPRAMAVEVLTPLMEAWTAIWREGVKNRVWGEHDTARWRIDFFDNDRDEPMLPYRDYRIGPAS